MERERGGGRERERKWNEQMSRFVPFHLAGTKKEGHCISGEIKGIHVAALCLSGVATPSNKSDTLKACHEFPRPWGISIYLRRMNCHNVLPSEITFWGEFDEIKP